MDVKDFENILNAQAQQPAAPAAPAATSQGSAWDGQLGQTVTLSGTARGEYTLNVRHRHGDAELSGSVPIIVT